MNEKQCRAIVLERAQGRCERCGTTRGRFSYHHRLKRGQGGPWSPENIVYVDGSGTTGCHGAIEASPNESDESGFHCRPWQNPESKPILLHGRQWVRLHTSEPCYIPIELNENERPT